MKNIVAAIMAGVLLVGCGGVDEAVDDAIDAFDNNDSEVDKQSDAGNSSDNGTRRETTGNFSELVGVYNWNDTTEDDNSDEGYIVIDQQGIVSEYDYAGDSFDNFANCYWVEEELMTLEPASGNRYKANYEDNEFFGEVHFSSVNGGMKMSLSFDGTTVDFVYPVTSLTVSDLSPNCDD